MSDTVVYIKGILSEIRKVKRQGKRGVYRVRDDVSDETIKCLRKLFRGHKEYSLSAHKCHQCQNKWEVMVYFVKESNA